MSIPVPHATLPLGGRHIVLGLSGGIACFKSAELVRALTAAGASVQVVMTEAACQFITPVTMQALSGQPVVLSQWDVREPNNMAHINLSREADAILVAPASADFIAQLAQGRANDLLALLCLARPIAACPLLLAPAMNREMWDHPATRRNCAQVTADGATLLGPGNGDQACGETGDGRMLEAAELCEDLIAPASADMFAKLAQGRADELLSLLCLARPIDACPLLLAPAMNREMWSHPATQRNVAQAVADGATLLGPASGEQACGEVGDGRMLEAEELLDEVIAFFQPKRLAGQRVLITAGPTFEAIDPVRGITNLSSGKMGFAIARAAHEAGAEVTLVAGPVHLATPRGVRRIDVQSAQQMHDAVLPLAAQHGVFVATAAVADWRPANAAGEKIKKDGSGQVPAIGFTENPDILAAVARLPGGPYCVGFAAESHDLARHAREKRLRKGVPLIVGNLGPATFGRDDNTLLLVDADGERELPTADKLSLARALVAEIAQRLGPTA